MDMTMTRVIEQCHTSILLHDAMHRDVLRSNLWRILLELPFCYNPDLAELAGLIQRLEDSVKVFCETWVDRGRVPCEWAQ